MKPNEQQMQTDDLRAFEQRLTESVDYIHSKTWKWRVILLGVLLWMLYSLWLWWTTSAAVESLWELMYIHWSLTLSVSILLVLIVTGVCERARTARIVTARCRNVLKDYNMSCDEGGKLILKKAARHDAPIWSME